MKKIIMGTLIAVMLVVLAACGNGGSTQPETGAVEETKAAKKDNGKSFSATIEETVILDSQGVKITAKELTYDNYYANLALLIENNSETSLKFYAGTLGYCANSINGYMVEEGYLVEEIAPGMTANEKMNFSKSGLQLLGINDIADICVGFHIEADGKDYLTTGPLQIKTSLSGYDYSKDTFTEAMKDGSTLSNVGASKDYGDDTEMYNVGEIRNLSNFVIINKDGDQMFLTEAVNESGSDAYLVISNLALNDLVVSSGNYTSSYISAGNRGVLQVNFSYAMDEGYKAVYGNTGVGKISFDVVKVDSDYNTLGQQHVELKFGDVKELDEAGEVVYDANGIKIISKGKQEDELSFSDDIHLLFMVKNEGDKEISVGTDFSGVYVNKMKISDITYSVSIKPGSLGMLDVQLMGSYLEDNNLTLDNITEASINLEIRDENYHEIDTPTIEVKY